MFEIASNKLARNAVEKTFVSTIVTDTSNEMKSLALALVSF
jgi:hypothetical protein